MAPGPAHTPRPHMQRPVSLPGPCPSRELAEADPPSLMTPCSESPLSWVSSPFPIGLSSLCSSNSTVGFYNRGPTLLWLPWKRQEETSQSGSLNVPANKAITTKGCVPSLSLYRQPYGSSRGGKGRVNEFRRHRSSQCPPWVPHPPPTTLFGNSHLSAVGTGVP